MDRIVELEQEHAQVYNDLLKALDNLYVLKQDSGKLNSEMEKTLEIRRQLQISLEKSAATLRAIQRFTQDRGSDKKSASTEDILGDRLMKIMQDNYNIDYKIKDFLKREDELSGELRRERSAYWELVERFKKATGTINEQTAESPSESRSIQTIDEDNNLQTVMDQNEILEQLLVALKIHGGYDPFM